MFSSCNILVLSSAYFSLLLWILSRRCLLLSISYGTPTNSEDTLCCALWLTVRIPSTASWLQPPSASIVPMPAMLRALYALGWTEPAVARVGKIDLLLYLILRLLPCFYTFSFMSFHYLGALEWWGMRDGLFSKNMSLWIQCTFSTT